MNIPEQYYAWILSAGGQIQSNWSYDSDGRIVYEGIAATSASINDPAWTVQKTLYTGSNVSPAHQSILTGVSWAGALLGIYTFP